MDDSLEHPTAALQSTNHDEDDRGSSSDEEGALDWSKLPAFKSAPTIDRPIIPKRGEKEYEPIGGPSSASPNTGSNLQKHTLERARNAMYTTLKAERGISTKSLSYGLWFPQTRHAEVVLARGTLFSAVGYSNHPRRSPDVTLDCGGRAKDEKGKTKRTELLPEEALYLVERGSMYCWRVDNLDDATKLDAWGPTPRVDIALDDMPGAPMSVQQAFADMIGSGDGELTLEKYQVYAYLKRLGYVVIRAEKPRDVALYPLAAKPATPARPRAFRKLRIIPAGHNTPLQVHRPTTSSSYKPFYHVYKPSTAFKKSAPPPPDFCIVVINARTTPLPSLLEMSDLFGELPVVPVQPPRSRKGLPANNAMARQMQNPSTGAAKPVGPKSTSLPSLPLLSRIRSYLLHPFTTLSPTGKKPPNPPGPNPFVALKAGRKNFIVAAVDNGSISFIRFSEGCFEDWPMQ
ncbi:tRNA-splicing endonuclease subunit sen54 [Tulasnella sp. 403]|nr:tRNA-splicing endonuclease subunit sen54 [Tulasnella sp. 403]